MSCWSDAAEVGRPWTEGGMIEDVSGVTIPVSVIVADRDQVERDAAIRQAISPLIPPLCPAKDTFCP